MTENKRTLLMILDGWGLEPDPSISAIEAAHTPYFDSLWANYPHATLITHGEDVGLPDGQMGNSEVGHLNIGAGRIIYQDLARINKAIREGELDHNPVLHSALNQTRGTLHLMGLVSDGGVHSHVDHLLALSSVCRSGFSGKIFIHAFTDGRDVDPRSGSRFIRKVEETVTPLGIQIATVIGRYYAMDRDRRWDRIRLAYDLLVRGKGTPTSDLAAAIQRCYDDAITDEFIPPLYLADDQGSPVTTIRDGDTVIFFNFRTDRPRQLTEVLSQKAHPDQDMHPLDLQMVTMTRYDGSFKNIHTLFEENDLRGTLGEYLSSLGKTQLRVAETEKYPHVSYFFSGGHELPFPGEARILVPSPQVATYDLQPEMSAVEVTNATLQYIDQHHPDFVCLNFANTDMVGHTGVFSAAIRATETVDQCLSRLVPYCVDMGYSLVIIADHGNADCMVNPDGSPNTAHTKNPVPILYIDRDAHQYTLQNGRLADIAPTLLYIMGLKIPSVMDGRILLSLRASTVV